MREKPCRIRLTFYPDEYPRLMAELSALPMGKRRAGRLLTLAEIGTLVDGTNGLVSKPGAIATGSQLALDSEQLADLTSW